MTPILSVVIPCYNMGQFVPDAIESVLSYPRQEDIEIIVVNDGSNDHGYTKSVLDKFTANNLRIIHQNNRGLGAARNNAIKAARGSFIIPLDADNKIRHDFITLGINILETKPEVGLVYGDLQQFGSFNQKVSVGSFDASKLIYKNYIDACVVLRKAAWESISGYDEEMPVMGYEDWDLNMRLFIKGWKFHYINKILFDYRVREDSMLVNSNKNKELLLKYIFSKPELEQASLLRKKIVGYHELDEKFEKFKSRKAIKTALIFERPLKRFAQIFKK